MKTVKELTDEIERQLKLKPEITSIGPPYVAINGEQAKSIIAGLLAHLKNVVDCCDEAFVDQGSPGGHYTTGYCLMCGARGTGVDCDEDCPMPEIRKIVREPPCE